MSLDERHLQLRKHLDKLGFNQPLPIGAIGLVSALVDDLIQTTESLKEAKVEIAQLLEEKAAWDLGAEPYKCDNSRLLSEVNSLHMQILKQADAFELEHAELRVRIRNLTYNNKVLDERNNELQSKIKELEIKFADTDKKSGHIHKRPFISTVRSGFRTPGILDLRGLNNQLQGKCKCSCTLARRNDVLCEIEKLQVEVNNLEDQLYANKKQIEARDREIMRLNSLFTGGRPADALAKDCCYKNVSALTEDVQYLQEQKMILEKKLAMVNDCKGDSMKKVHFLVERNAKLEQDLKDFEKVALSVEAEANKMANAKDKEIAKLKQTINETRNRLLNLEQGINSEAPNYDYLGKNDSNVEIQKLLKQITDLSVSEQLLLKENEKLKLKYLRQKSKQMEPIDIPSKVWHELEKAREEKEHYQKEYSRLMLESKTTSALEDKIAKLSCEVAERNMIVSDLKIQISDLQSQLRPKSKESDIQANITLQVNIQKLERERDIAIAARNQLIVEHENIKEQLRIAKEANQVEKENYEKHVANLNQQIAHHQSKERELYAYQRPSSATINMLKDENHKLIDEIKMRESEISQLKVSNNQIKILLEQTERAMTEQKNKLYHTEHHKEHVEQHTHKLEAENMKLNQEIVDLRSEMATLKTNNHALDKEKDRLIIDLDMKTEKIYHLENNIECMKKANRDLQENVDKLQRSLCNISSQKIENETTLRTATSEVDHLRNQISTLKRTCDNALNENSRLTNELAEAQSDLIRAKQKADKAHKDTETLREEIKQYVTEVERVNSILTEKEQELLDMIDNYKSITADAQSLEEMKQSLTYENNEARECLKEATNKIKELQEEIQVKNIQLSEYENQVVTLSSQISELENEIQSLKGHIAVKDSQLVNAHKTIENLKKEKDQINLANSQSYKNELPDEKPSTYERKPPLNRSNTYTRIDTTNIIEESQIKSSSNEEMFRLKSRVDQLENKLEVEESLETKADALAKEYKIQVQELKQLLKDERGAALNENANPYPTL
uniref:CSON010707 protein n=1 Tax=Culicoides sonorensis TaxID=179676 RepID=A0A336K4M7_CULSO